MNTPSGDQPSTPGGMRRGNIAARLRGADTGTPGAMTTSSAIALGIAVGASIGIAIGQLAIGVGIGVAVGAVIGAVQTRRRQK